MDLLLVEEKSWSKYIKGLTDAYPVYLHIPEMILSSFSCYILWFAQREFVITKIKVFWQKNGSKIWE